MRTVLSWFGLEIVYVCGWGEYAYRYDSADRHSGRPLHRHMMVAPPWAKFRIRRIKNT